MKKNLCAIVVPIYKPSMNEYEVLSLKACCRILGPNYPIIVVTHEGVDLSAYKALFISYGITISTEFFDAQYFAGVHGYNCLLMSPTFYDRFDLYDYMLIYQTDAFVFHDDLLQWCQQGYDYIGAPLFAPGYKDTMQYARVGNGGFSLRRVDAFREVLRHKFSLRELLKLNYPKHPYITCSKKINFVLSLWALNRFEKISDRMRYYVDEDRFFCFVLLGTTYQMYMPSVEEAVSFSFDMNPLFCYECTNHKLPFGCHSFFKRTYDMLYHQFVEDTIGQ